MNDLRKLGISFFLFGLINNVLYVLILSAALDLVPPSTPKGIIAFCNITPSLIAKIAWPYIISKGKIRYKKRLLGCAALSTTGIVVVAVFNGLYMRLLGIALASFSSGLGELTFLQLSTTYSPPSVAGHCVGYFASGTGAAGVAGALLWWEVRGLGVRAGMGMSSIMPSIIPLTYTFLLPSPSSLIASSLSSTTPSAYVPLASADSAEGVREDGEDDEFGGEEVDEHELTADHAEDTPSIIGSTKTHITLSANDKWLLVKPLLARYMVPLFCVYLFEYTINQGISPTLLYPVPTPQDSWLLSKIIHSVRDYYPLWQLVYQSNVFLSRSSISAGLPALPARWIKAPAFIQAAILAILGVEAGWGLFGGWAEGSEGCIWKEGVRNVWCVFALVCLEGICGGLAYVNVFHNLTHEPPPLPWSSSDEEDEDESDERALQSRAFQMGSIGSADSAGILLASLLAVPTEVGLCRMQVRRGKGICAGL